MQARESDVDVDVLEHGDPFQRANGDLFEEDGQSQNVDADGLEDVPMDDVAEEQEDNGHGLGTDKTQHPCDDSGYSLNANLGTADNYDPSADADPGNNVQQPDQDEDQEENTSATNQPGWRNLLAKEERRSELNVQPIMREQMVKPGASSGRSSEYVIHN